MNSQTASLLKPMSAVLSSVEGETPIIEDSALIADSGPMGTIADFEYLAPTSTNIETYMVKSGDNLGKIAQMFGVSVNTIAWANQDVIGRGNVIKEGQTLVILPITGIKHSVKKGDTIQSIAKLYKGDVDEIVKYNIIEDSKVLAIGDVIIVPDGEIKNVNVVAKTVSGVKSSGLPSYSGYYMRPIIGGTRTQGLHGYNAVDLASYFGTNILASAKGEVIVSRSSGWNGGYGSYIVLKHDNGTQTLYSHLSANFVGAGDYVYQGQVIGKMGNSGKVSGPTGIHLHFEIRGARNPF